MPEACFDAALIDCAEVRRDSHSIPDSVVEKRSMGDLIYIAILLACCGATAGLVVLCERLMPRDSAGSGAGKGGKP